MRITNPVIWITNPVAPTRGRFVRSPQMVFNFYSYRKGEKGRREEPDPPKTRHR